MKIECGVSTIAAYIVYKLPLDWHFECTVDFFLSVHIAKFIRTIGSFWTCKNMQTEIWMLDLCYEVIYPVPVRSRDELRATDDLHIVGPISQPASNLALFEFSQDRHKQCYTLWLKIHTHSTGSRTCISRHRQPTEVWSHIFIVYGM